MNKNELRIILLHEFKLGHSATEATRNICKAWGQNSITGPTTRRWFKNFRMGNMNLEDKERQGRPPSVNNDHLKVLIESNPNLTTRKLSAELGVVPTTISRHLASIGKVKKVDKWISPDESETQKDE